MPEKKKIFHLGDPQIARIVTVMNSYVYALFFLICAAVMLVNRAWLTFLLLMILVAINLPQARPYLDRFHVKGLLKLLICLFLIYLAIMSTGLYV